MALQTGQSLMASGQLSPTIRDGSKDWPNRTSNNMTVHLSQLVAQHWAGVEAPLTPHWVGMGGEGVVKIPHQLLQISQGSQLECCQPLHAWLRHNPEHTTPAHISITPGTPLTAGRCINIGTLPTQDEHTLCGARSNFLMPASWSQRGTFLRNSNFFGTVGSACLMLATTLKGSRSSTY